MFRFQKTFYLKYRNFKYIIIVIKLWNTARITWLTKQTPFYFLENCNRWFFLLDVPLTLPTKIFYVKSINEIKFGNFSKAIVFYLANCQRILVVDITINFTLKVTFWVDSFIDLSWYLNYMFVKFMFYLRVGIIIGNFFSNINIILSISRLTFLKDNCMRFRYI